MIKIDKTKKLSVNLIATLMKTTSKINKDKIMITVIETKK
jgi:hypothetical protein